MAKKKKPAPIEIPEPEPAPLDVDPTDPEADREDRRRLHYRKRFFTRSRSVRRKWLDIVQERDPEAYEDLMYWRWQNPQEYRKRLVRWCVDHDVYEERTYTSRELPPIEER